MKDCTNILIVDDYSDVRESLKDLLDSFDCIVKTAANGREALNLLKNEKIDLVITDILMPEMDGIELVTQARKLYPELRFLLISGGGRQTSEISSYDYLETASTLTGIASVLRKPFEPEEFIEMVNEVLAA